MSTDAPGRQEAKWTDEQVMAMRGRIDDQAARITSLEAEIARMKPVVEAAKAWNVRGVAWTPEAVAVGCLDPSDALALEREVEVLRAGVRRWKRHLIKWSGDEVKDTVQAHAQLRAMARRLGEESRRLVNNYPQSADEIRAVASHLNDIARRFEARSFAVPTMVPWSPPPSTSDMIDLALRLSLEADAVEMGDNPDADLIRLLRDAGEAIRGHGRWLEHGAPTKAPEHAQAELDESRGSS